MVNSIINELSSNITQLASNYKTVIATKQDILQAHTANKTGKVFTTDINKSWTFSEFQSEGKQVQIDVNKLNEKEKAFFENYQLVCDNYIKEISKVYQNKNNNAKKNGNKLPHNLPITITGKMLADAALKTYVKYNDINKVVPIKFMLAQLQSESAFGTQTPREASKISPFNVGVYDTKDADYLQKLESKQQGIEMYFDVMAEDYLSKRSANELTNNFVNENNKRYATNPNYEKTHIQPTINMVDKRSEKGGITIANTDGLNVTKNPSHNSETPIQSKITTKNTPTSNTTKNISDSVGQAGKNIKQDVITIQSLLNRKGAKLEVDGSCGILTITAIKTYQKYILNIPKPDGRIDVNGPTWKALSSSGNTPPSNNIPVVNANPILNDSVGINQTNNPINVKLIKELLNKKINAGLDVNNPTVAEKTIAAIKFFQKKSNIEESGIIEKNGSTWKALFATLKTPNSNGEASKLDDIKLHGKLYGAETETEKKLEEFTKSLNGIKVQINQNNIVYVRPPYHINKGSHKEDAEKNRTSDVIKAAQATGTSLTGKATPPEISAFLELCIKRNLIPEKNRNAEGLRDFLDKNGISMDCSGLANQAINFLLDGNFDFDKKNDAIDITAVGTSSMTSGNFKKIDKPSDLKAGDVMVKNGHVRLIIDVDKIADGAIEFTTTESTTGKGPEGGDGVRQVRWKFPKNNEFKNLQKQNYSTELFANATNDEMSYIYTRHKKLDDVPA